MKILHKSKNDSWEQIESEPYNNEAELQDLIADDASILPFDDIGYDEHFVTIGKEVGLHGNSLDLLAISPKGHIAVIETKLSRNPEIRREVVGQVLSYAASLWKMTYADLERYFKKYVIAKQIKFDGSLHEYMKLKCPDTEVDEAEFKDGLEKRLDLGSFSLLIVVDALGESNKELVEIANYLNDRTGQEIDFYVVEIERIGDHAGSYLLPRLANPPHKNVSTAVKGASGSADKYDRKPLTQEEFLSRLSSAEQQIALAFINAATFNNKIGISWRKTGFSIWTMIPRAMTQGVYDYESGYAYLFFQASEKNGDYQKAISFWYTESSYESLPKLREYVQTYRNNYHSIKPYDAVKKVIQLKDLTLTDARAMVADIVKTGKAIGTLDKDRLYDKSYK